MRYRLIFIICIVLIMITAVTFENASFKKNRYHQHKHDIISTKDFKESTNNTFSTHLPLIDISTDMPIPNPFIIDEKGNRKRNDEMVSATIKYYDSEMKNNFLEDIPTITEKSLIRIRGRSSRNFDKKGYLLKFKKNNLIDNKKISLSGMTADSNWALHGPYMDKTLIRNYLCYNLAGEIMDYSPNVGFCEIFLNGEYQGIYLLTEKIEYNDAGRIKITQTDPDMKSTSYILRLDVGSEDPFFELNTFSFYTGKNGSKDKGSGMLEIIYPGKTLTSFQKEYIEKDISKFEKALVSFDSADGKWGYPSFIDIDSFVDYFIINEFTMNSDAARLSTYFYKDIRGKMKIAVWDFNSAFNNYVPEMADPHYFMMTDKFWYEYLLRDSSFVDRIIKRYRELRKTYLSDEYLLNYIDETVSYLGLAIYRNNDVWGYSFSKEYDLLLPTSRNPRTYDDAVKQLKDMIVERGSYLDKNIETLYALSHDSVNKQFKHRRGEYR